MPNPIQPEFIGVGPSTQGWWHVLRYDKLGMRVPFDVVNDIPVDDAANSPTYVIDTTSSAESSDGLFMIVSGCIVDVDKLAHQMDASRNRGIEPENIPALELTNSGSVIPLSSKSGFKLPTQEVGKHLTIEQGNKKHKPVDKEPIKSIEVDLRPYGVHSAKDAIKFAAKTGIVASGIDISGGTEVTKGDLGGTPITRAARRLNYSLVSVEAQARMKRPLNKEEVIDKTRKLIAVKVAEL